MTMAITVFILISLLHTVTCMFDACWEIEADPPCNDDYYANNLGCHYDTNDTSCMCRITNDIIDVIYLVDISTSAVIEPSNFSCVAHLIQDVTNSTLVISPSTEIFNQLILYDMNQYPQTPNINAESIDINQYTRTQLNDLQTAMSSAIQTFENSNLDGRRVLVIFNGQMQKDYTQDDVNICPVKATLVNAGITVIVVSYTPYDATEEARDLTCLVDTTDPSSNDAYNPMPYSAIVQAPEFGWNGFPIEAKLSWDLCETARPLNTITLNITCDDMYRQEWVDFREKLWFGVTVPPNTNTIILETCSIYTEMDTVLALYDSTGNTLVIADDNGCNDTDNIGRSRIEHTVSIIDTETIFQLHVANPHHSEGYLQLNMSCIAPPPPTPAPTKTLIPIACDNMYRHEWVDFTEELWFEVTVPPNTKTIILETCSNYTTMDTVLNLYDSTGDSLLTTDDDGCNDNIGRSRIEYTVSMTDTETIFQLHVENPKPSEGYLQLNVSCIAATTTTPPTTANPTQEPTPNPSPRPTSDPTPTPTTPPPVPTTFDPTFVPTFDPTLIPTTPPPVTTTTPPNPQPTEFPTFDPTLIPTTPPPVPTTTPPVPTTTPPPVPTTTPPPVPTTTPPVPTTTPPPVPTNTPPPPTPTTPFPTYRPTPVPTRRPADTPTPWPTKKPTSRSRWWNKKPTPTPTPPPVPTPWPTLKPTNSDKECINNQTNWRFEYKHSFVVRKKKKKYRKGWWSIKSGSRSGSMPHRHSSHHKPKSHKTHSESNKKRSTDNDDSNKSKSSVSSHGSVSGPGSSSSSGDTKSSMEFEHKLAICLVYNLIITDDNNNCYGDATSIEFFMINLPPECDGDVSLKQIQDVFYYNLPNNFDIVYDDITQKIGFGEKYHKGYGAVKPGIPSETEFTLCFEKCAVDAFDIVDTNYFIEGDNNYYSKDGKTLIADVCKLITSTRDSSDSSTKEDRYGYPKRHKSHSSSERKTNNIWSKSIEEKSRECKMDDTNWNLKYKRSYVSRQQHSSRDKKHAHRKKKGWWHKKRYKRRRAMGYKYKFSPGIEEFYEDEMSEKDYEIEDEIDVLSSCFIYEIECNLGNAKCFNSPSKIVSFSIDIPYNCGGNGEVSIPEINHAFYWSQPDTFTVVYDKTEHGLAFGLSYDGYDNIPLSLGEKREFTLCFRRNQLNPYSMISSKWKAKGENQYYSVDGTVYVPDICQLRQ